MKTLEEKNVSGCLKGGSSEIECASYWSSAVVPTDGEHKVVRMTEVSAVWVLLKHLPLSQSAGTKTELNSMVILPSRLERRGQEEADEISTRVKEGGIVV